MKISIVAMLMCLAGAMFAAACSQVAKPVRVNIPQTTLEESMLRQEITRSLGILGRSYQNAKQTALSLDESLASSMQLTVGEHSTTTEMLSQVNLFETSGDDKLVFEAIKSPLDTTRLYTFEYEIINTSQIILRRLNKRIALRLSGDAKYVQGNHSLERARFVLTVFDEAGSRDYLLAVIDPSSQLTDQQAPLSWEFDFAELDRFLVSVDAEPEKGPRISGKIRVKVEKDGHLVVGRGFQLNRKEYKVRYEDFELYVSEKDGTLLRAKIAGEIFEEKVDSRIFKAILKHVEKQIPKFDLDFRPIEMVPEN